MKKSNIVISLVFITLTTINTYAIQMSNDQIASIKGVHWISDNTFNQYRENPDSPEKTLAWNVETIIGHAEWKINDAKKYAQKANEINVQNLIRFDYGEGVVPKDPSKYNEWVNQFRDIVNRFNGIATRFIVGNEPNLDNEGKITPTEYAAAYKYLKDNIGIDGIELLVAGPANFAAIDEVQDYEWLQQLVSELKSLHVDVDGFALHTYSSINDEFNGYMAENGITPADPREPCVPNPATTTGGGKLFPENEKGEKVGDCSFQRFRNFINLLGDYSDKPVYLTEWNTFGFGCDKNNYYHVPAGNYPTSFEDGNPQTYMERAFEAIKEFNQESNNFPKIHAICWFVDAKTASREDNDDWLLFSLNNSNESKLVQARADFINASSFKGFN